MVGGRRVGVLLEGFWDLWLFLGEKEAGIDWMSRWEVSNPSKNPNPIFPNMEGLEEGIHTKRSKRKVLHLPFLSISLNTFLFPSSYKTP